MAVIVLTGLTFRVLFVDGEVFIESEGQFRVEEFVHCVDTDLIGMIFVFIVAAVVGLLASCELFLEFFGEEVKVVLEVSFQHSDLGALDSGSGGGNLGVGGLPPGLVGREDISLLFL